MDLLTIVIVLIGVGVLLWLMKTYIPMDATIQRIIVGVVVIVVVLWLLRIFGILDRLGSVTI